MDVLTLLIAVVALVVAILAFQKAGGIHDLRQQLDDLSKKSEQATRGARETAADAINRLESFIRGQGKTPPGPDEPHSSEDRPEDKP